MLAGQLIASLGGVPAHAEWIGVALVATIGGACGLRMIWEIKPSRGALATLALAVIGYVAATLMTLGVVVVPQPWTVAAPLAAIAGHMFVLLTVAVFGRYVHLEARGELAARPRKEKPPREKKAAKTKTAGAEKSDRSAKKRPAKSDLAEAAPESKSSNADDKKPAPAASKPAAKSPPTLSIQDDEEDEDGAAPMSKAERRRLRKLNKQKQRAA